MTEFARYVGLSRSAISRVLNNQSGLRRETIERVRAALAETGFTVNAHALHLRGRPTTTIGVCMEDLETPTSVRKLSVLQSHLRARGYTTLIEVLQPGATARAVQHLMGLRVDGILFIGYFAASELSERLEELRRNGTPHLIVDDPRIPGANTVSLDRASAMAEVTRHLLDLGHRRFGLLGISGPWPSVKARLMGVEQALLERGLDVAKSTLSLDYLHPQTQHFDYGALLAQSFAALPSMPTAFLAVNDETAVGAMQEFQARGYRVPEDLSIVGFNNQNICLMTRPRLSSVDQQIEESMALVAETFVEMIGPASPPTPLLRSVAARWIPRGTTGPAPTRRD